MKHLITYLVLFFALLNIWSCAKKKYPESVTENEPFYYSKFDVNGTTMEFKAGENDFYMYSEVSKDSFNVNEFSSTFRRTNCNPCGPSLKFVIRDYKVSSPTSPSNIDSTIRVGAYEYLKDINGPLYSSEFTATKKGDGTAISYDWDFGNGIKLTGSTVSHVFNSTGPHKICVSMRTTKGCVSNMCNEFFVGGTALKTALSATADSGTVVKFFAAANDGSGGYSYFWDFGDGVKTKGNAQISHTYPYHGSYLAKLTVTDNTGAASVLYYNVVTKQDLSSCAVNFNQTSITEISGIEQSLSKVRVVYTDAQGVSYHSLSKGQPSTSHFEILDIKEGEPNEQGKRTKTVNVKFNCEVFNGGQKISIANGLSTISIAY